MHFRPAAENPLRSREDVERLLLDLVGPLLPHFSPGHAGIRLGAFQPWYGEPASSLEGFARPLWGLVPFAVAGGACSSWPAWREGLVNGTNPEHTEFWGWPEDCDQRCVEMPIIALGAALLPEELWLPLTEAERNRVAAWFASINTVAMVDNNWHFFRVLVNVALRRLGRAWSAERLTEDLRRLDEFHLGGGWYADGAGRRGDYYVPMAFHCYGLLFAWLAEPAEAAWAEKFRARAVRFAETFERWFAADGEAIPFGRSLTYRSAQGAFWGALALGAEPTIGWAAVKGLYLRHLRWWMRRPIFSETGLLSVGYGFPNLAMGENYNGPGSPYWAFKAFLPLALPEDHPFWRATEAASSSARPSLTVEEAGLIVSSDRSARLVVALNAGQAVTDYPRHAPQKYSKFAYATHFGFGVPLNGGGLASGGYDSVLALSEDGARFVPRGECHDTWVLGPVAHAVWRPWADVEVTTWLIAAGTDHVRIHRIRSGRRLWSSDAGFAVPFRNPHELRFQDSRPDLLTLSSPLGGCAVQDTSGGRAGERIIEEPNANLRNPLTAVPTLRGRHPAGETWLATIVRAWLGSDAPLTDSGDGLAVVLAEGAARVTLAGVELFNTRQASPAFQ